MYNWLQMHTSTVNCSNLSFHVVRMKLHIIWTFGFWMNLQIYDSIAKHTGTTFNMLQNKKGTADKHCHNNKSKILVKTGYAYGQTHTNTHISSRYSTPSGGGVKNRYVTKSDSSTWLWGPGGLSLTLWTAAAAAVGVVVVVVVAVVVVVVTEVAAVTAVAGIIESCVTADIVEATAVTVSDLFYNTNSQACCYHG